jgi:hypothetical protein
MSAADFEPLSRISVAVATALRTAEEIANQDIDASTESRERAARAAEVLGALQAALMTADNKASRLALGRLGTGARLAWDHMPSEGACSAPIWTVWEQQIGGDGIGRDSLAEFIVRLYAARGYALDRASVATALTAWGDTTIVAKAAHRAGSRGRKPCSCAACTAKAIERAVLRLAGVVLRSRKRSAALRITRAVKRNSPE